MIATKYAIKAGIGVSDKHLPSFDKALLKAGVGNYNLVRLSSILPAGCKHVTEIDLTEGRLLPTAYSTVSCDKKDVALVSTIGVGIPSDKSHVGVIMEYSALEKTPNEALKILKEMIYEAFEIRGWQLDHIECGYSFAVVEKDGEETTTFACIAEW